MLDYRVARKREEGPKLITNVLSYLVQSANQCPDRTALADAETSLDYRSLWAMVRTAGSSLTRRLKVRNEPLAVCITHSVQDLVLFFAAVYSGNCYVPLDLTLPEERVRSILETAAPAAILFHGQTDLPKTDCPALSLEDLLSEEGEETSPWQDGKDTDPLYVIFTSGSTGAPKGVCISHRSVIDMTEQFSRVFAFPEGSVFGNQAPFDFDVSVKDIYLSLRCHGRVEILEKKLFSFPKLLIRRLNERRVDTIIWAVPALKIISSLRAFKTEKPEHLRLVMFSGEVMPVKTLSYWLEQLPDAHYVNLYGPTEITCNCTYFPIDPTEDYTAGIPIGNAFPNCRVFLLEDDRLITEDGQIGEICVTGSCLALGYYGRPDLTAAAFPPNPLEPRWPEPMYRTGDLGTWQNGRLMFEGRRDSQIKHMGHRIEMGEIELCANAFPGVEVSACVYWEEKARICLAYTGTADPSELRSHIQDRLPKYMLPAALRPIAEFPRTRTGKIDRKALLADYKGDK